MITPEQLCAQCGECCCCKPSGPIMSLAEMLAFSLHIDTSKTTFQDVIPLLDKVDGRDSRGQQCPFLSRNITEGFKCVIYPIRPESCQRYKCRALELLAAEKESEALRVTNQGNWTLCKRWVPIAFLSRFPAAWLKTPSSGQ